MPSHPGAPHAGNAFGVLKRYPDAEFVVPDYDTAHELHMMDEAIISPVVASFGTCPET